MHTLIFQSKSLHIKNCFGWKGQLLASSAQPQRWPTMYCKWKNKQNQISELEAHFLAHFFALITKLKSTLYKWQCDHCFNLYDGRFINADHCSSNFVGNTHTEAPLWHVVQQTFVTHDQPLKSKATPVSVMVMIIGPFLSFLCFVQYSLIRQGTQQTKGFTIHLEHEKDVSSVTQAALKKRCNYSQ